MNVNHLNVRQFFQNSFRRQTCGSSPCKISQSSVETISQKGNKNMRLNPLFQQIAHCATQIPLPVKTKFASRMLKFLAKGENAINGFRNHDLRKWLYRESEQAGKDQQKKYSGRTTRRIKLLRAHGLIRKVPRPNRYVLTEKGQKFSCSLMTASALDIKSLTEMAA